MFFFFFYFVVRMHVMLDISCDCFLWGGYGKTTILASHFFRGFLREKLDRSNKPCFDWPSLQPITQYTSCRETTTLFCYGWHILTNEEVTCNRRGIIIPLNFWKFVLLIYIYLSCVFAPFIFLLVSLLNFASLNWNSSLTSDTRIY